MKQSELKITIDQVYVITSINKKSAVEKKFCTNESRSKVLKIYLALGKRRRLSESYWLNIKFQQVTQENAKLFQVLKWVLGMFFIILYLNGDVFCRRRQTESCLKFTTV